MKFLITGGLGFIGSNFCRYLLSEHPDYELKNLDKIGIGANPINLQDLEKNSNYSFIKGDISNAHLMKKLIGKADVIVNFAAETHVDRSIANPNVFLQNNTIGTFTILEVLRKQKTNATLIQVSTDEVYGQALQESFTEKSPAIPSNPYSASKAAADMFVLSYNRTYDIDIRITRCTNNFGPYQLPEKLIPKTIIRALKNLHIPVYGTGENIRDWIYVIDHCIAIERVIQKGTPGEIYNISARNEIRNIDLVKKILLLLNKSEKLIKFVKDRPGHDKRYSLDAKKAEKELFWLPKFSFEDSIQSTVKWYVENKKWWVPFANETILHSSPWTQSVTY
jgi:dTDP-glucose 4,6-dehydratase